MMNRMRPLLFILIVSLQIGALGYMVLDRELILRNGRVAYLACKPIDPRSLLSGDYVRLRYQISDFSGRQLNHLNRRAQSFETGNTVYVALKAPPGRGAVPATDEALPADLRPFIPVAIDKDVDAARQAGDVVLRATVERSGENSVRLVYGAEQYFIPQFAGGEIEDRIEDVIVEVRVADDGETAIKRLFIDDAEVEFH